MKSDTHSRNLRLHRAKDVPATFFITKSLHPKKPVLNKAARETVTSAFAFAVQQERTYLRAFVVMLDHWHALFALREPWTLPKFMHDLMSYVGGRKEFSPRSTTAPNLCSARFDFSAFFFLNFFKRSTCNFCFARGVRTNSTSGISSAPLR